MIKWGEDKRKQDPEYFCRLAVKNCKFPVWIVSDSRRPTDLKFFQTYYREQLILVRVFAEDHVRKSRGWVFTSGVDDADSECALDEFGKWDFVVDNDGDNQKLTQKLLEIIEVCNQKRKKNKDRGHL